MALRFRGTKNGGTEEKGDYPSDKTHALTNNESPELTASFLSKLTFHWFGEFINSSGKTLSVESLWDLKNEDLAQTQCGAFEANINERVREGKPMKNGEDLHGSVRRALIETFRRDYLYSLLWRIICTATEFITPLLMREILRSSNSDEPMWIAVAFCFCLLFGYMIDSFVSAAYNFRAYTLGMRVRTALNVAVYKKSLVLSNKARRTETAGGMVNLMSGDTRTLMDVPGTLNSVCISPFQIVISMILICRDLGASAFAGFIGLLLIVPIGSKLRTLQRANQKTLMGFSDQRLKITSELISGIKVVKLYAWELGFKKLIDKFRAGEMEKIRKNAVLDGLQQLMWFIAPYTMSVLTFACYVILNPNKRLTAEKAFVALALFRTLQRPLTKLPSALYSLVQASVSMRRLEQFLSEEELAGYVTHVENDRNSIEIKHADFSWDESNNSLTDINVSVAFGELVGVVGRVAQGKSSLISGILGNTNLKSGRVNVLGSIAYVPQQAWLQNATLRDNILFGLPYDSERYWDIVHRSGLVEDLSLLPASDLTEIGEKGINLSGGQKQRISVARAAYADADVYLFDDPLSAVDAHVGAHIFTELIGNEGLLRNKTRILVTHAVQFLSKLDRVIVIDEGKIAAEGKYRDLMITRKDLRSLLRRISEKGSPPEDADEDLTEERPKRNDSSVEEALGEPGKLIKEETSSSDEIKWDVYRDFLDHLGIGSLTSILFFVLTSVGFQLASSVWLAKWSREEDHAAGWFHLMIYALLGLMRGLLTFAGIFVRIKSSVKVSARIHDKLLSSVLHSPMSFFDTTPLGRILSRFASEMRVIDLFVCDTILCWFLEALRLLAIGAILCYNIPSFFVAIMPFAAVYFIVKEEYVSTMRYAGRLEGQTRSPIISHFSETLQGVDVIRSFCVEPVFINEYLKRVDANQKCYYTRICANRWLSIRLDACAYILTFCTALLSVTMRENSDAGTAGLCLTYALTATFTLNMFIKCSTALEADFLHTERVLEYTKLESEACWTKNQPDGEWPLNGAIQFQKYSTRYRQNSPLVVRSLDISIDAGEKIGICGRTGAGKSSLTMALFRLLEAAEGAVVIDGIRIDSIGLHDLREKLTIIPQEPVLFSGTLRFNLDPLEVYSDSKLLDVLEHAHMLPFVEQQDQGLDSVVAEGGSNLSVGQRQLICLARALLRKSRILVLDEATASVDIKTDKVIQETIRKEFTHSTILTIAHRINTIIDYDRILVLDAGQVKEFDSPKKLLQDRESLFSKLVAESK